MIVDLLGCTESKSEENLFVEIANNIWACPRCNQYSHLQYVLPNFHKVKCAWCHHEAFANGATSPAQQRGSIWVTVKGVFINPIVVAQGKKIKKSLIARPKFSP